MARAHPLGALVLALSLGPPSPGGPGGQPPRAPSGRPARSSWSTIRSAAGFRRCWLSRASMSRWVSRSWRSTPRRLQSEVDKRRSDWQALAAQRRGCKAKRRSRSGSDPQRSGRAARPRRRAASLYEARTTAFSAERRSLEEVIRQREREVQSAQALAQPIGRQLEDPERAGGRGRQAGRQGLLPATALSVILREVAETEGAVTQARQHQAIAAAALEEATRGWRRWSGTAGPKSWRSWRRSPPTATARPKASPRRKRSCATGSCARRPRASSRTSRWRRRPIVRANEEILKLVRARAGC